MAAATDRPLQGRLCCLWLVAEPPPPFTPQTAAQFSPSGVAVDVASNLATPFTRGQQVFVTLRPDANNKAKAVAIGLPAERSRDSGLQARNQHRRRELWSGKHFAIKRLLIDDVPVYDEPRY